MSSDSDPNLIAEPSPAANAAAAETSPFRFGLKALMLLMALCGVQFALMSYLGILIGLLVGLGACVVVLSGLVVSAMLFWRGSGTPLMHRLDQLAIRLVVAILLLAIGSFFAGGGLAIYQQVRAWKNAAKLQKELGFTAEEQMIVHNNQVRWGLVVRSIDLGGPFDNAGAELGDVVLCERGIAPFYESIEENRGQEISITVAAEAEIQPVEKCVSRRLDVMVPN